MNKFKMCLLAALSMVFWGSAFVWTKVALDYYRPLTIVLLRLVIATAILSVWSLFFKKKEKIDKEDFPKFMLLTFFEPFCYFLGESFGMTHVSATLGSIIISTIPLLTPIFAFLFLNERLTKYGLGGLLISFLGVVAIVSNNFEGSASVKGVALMMFAVFSGIGYGVYLKKLSGKYSSVTIVRIQSFLGALFFLPLFILFEYKHFSSVQIDFRIVSTLLKLSVFASIMAFALFTAAVRKIGLNTANLFTNLIAVVTAIVSYFVLKEAFNVQKIVGVAIVVSGLFLSQYPDIKIAHSRIVANFSKRRQMER